MVEDLGAQPHATRALLASHLEDVFAPGGPLELRSLLPELLGRCFWRIQYPASERAVTHVHELTQYIQADARLCDTLLVLCLQWLHGHVPATQWWLPVVTTGAGLGASSSLRAACLNYLQSQVEHPLAMLLYSLEDYCALRTLSSLRDGVCRRCRLCVSC